MSAKSSAFGYDTVAVEKRRPLNVAWPVVAALALVAALFILIAIAFISPPIVASAGEADATSIVLGP